MDWTPTKKALPPKNKVVLTMSEGGLVQKLKRIENLWFHEDGLMYVYYTPVYWKEAD